MKNLIPVLAVLGVLYFLFFRKKPLQPISSVNGLNDGGTNANGEIVGLDNNSETQIVNDVEMSSEPVEQPDTFTNTTGNGSVTAPNGVPEMSTGTPFPPQINTLDITSSSGSVQTCTSPTFSANLSACYDEAGNINGNYQFSQNWAGTGLNQPYGNTKVRFGQESCNVAEFQRLLNQIQPENPVAVDGSYGCNTLKKLCTIQKCSSVVADVNGVYSDTFAGFTSMQQLYNHFIIGNGTSNSLYY